MIKYTFRNTLEHVNDDVKNVGFDYLHNSLLKKYLSPLIFENMRIAAILYKIDNILIELIENVKLIKHNVNFMFDEKWRKFN